MWILVGLLCLAGVWMFWHQGGRSQAHRKVMVPSYVTTRSFSTAPRILATLSTNTVEDETVPVNTNKFAYRLANSTKSIDQLLRDDKAILLENALIDTRNSLNLSIPANLRSQTDPGAYIVQARGPIDNAFRAMLSRAGATIVSYIPNNAYLVRISQGGMNGLAASPMTQAVIPYEPYYKISSSMSVMVGQRSSSSASTGTHRVKEPALLDLALDQKPLPAGTGLTLGLFSDGAVATVAQIEKLGGQILAQDRSPFGPIVRVRPPTDWITLAQLPGVQRVEPYYQRTSANDLSRVTVGVSTDTITANNYMGLTGSNVVVEVNDTGIDTNHPDFKTGISLPIRVIGDAVQSLVDTNGHGTHVAGIIAGNGTESSTINSGAKLPPGSVTGADFRGKATLATLYSVGGINGGSDTNVITDRYLQEVPARTNALISNNSWNYSGDDTYDLGAASYDAAVRDALPTATGSQPVLFVFSAGNDGGGNDSGGGGTPDSILSPATAKNVITVGAAEQLRNITSVVTNAAGSPTTPWKNMTDTGYQIAGYSSRGNVGIGFEGTYGRYKPDVVAPGTFVVSTRSGQWDTNAYYNPTNITALYYSDQVVYTDAPNYYPLINLASKPNAVGVTIRIVPNVYSPSPLYLPIYFSKPPGHGIYPDPATPSTYYLETNTVTIPPDPAGYGTYLSDAITAGGFRFAVGDSDTRPISYDLIREISATNDLGNYYDVLRTNLNDPIAPWYRYETGTSMSAADVSGVLALMQDFFTNQWHTLPSPALLKAMIINGARKTANYSFQVNNSINFQGWGLINLPSALQPGITNQFGQSCSTFVLDQNPTNALATGDNRTFYVSVTNPAAPLRVTLAWTDPPGDPAAAVKLVNDLDLVVTNLDNGTVYYGNDIHVSATFNSSRSTNALPNFDSINNVENVYISPLLGTNFAINVIGYRVNVNAVSAQTNNSAGVYAPNVVQDYALVISSGDGQVTSVMVVTPTPMVSNPTGDQQITYLSGSSGILLNQTVGANTPLMGTNALSITNLASLSSTNFLNGITNEQITIGMTNQWHFYVVTNTAGFTNAAFVTYIPDTLSIPRMGVFAGSQANATRPEADIDVYVSTNSALTNLDPAVVFTIASNGLVSASGSTPNVSATAAGDFEMASLGRNGTEYVVDTNSQPGEVYYVGVKSEDQMASEYNFLSVFSATPFSVMNNGNEIVTAVGVPVVISDGNPAVSGYTDVVAIAIYPIKTRRVIATNVLYAEDLGDLVGSVYHGTTSVILNNHSLPVNGPGTYSFIYDDSGQGDVVGSQQSDGPGNLRGYVGQEGAGVWVLHEADNAVGFSNAVENFNLVIEPHRASNGTNIITTVAGGTWYYDYIDVPPGATNLIITVTNLTGTILYPGTQKTVYLYDKYGDIPTLTSYDQSNIVNIATAPAPAEWGSVTNGPPLTAGRYYIGVWNPTGNSPQTVSITVNYYGPPAAQVDYTSAGPAPILDDAVTDFSIPVGDDAIISSVDVGLCVEHPRVSDLVFHLISPDGTRELLMENRGGTDTNGVGATVTNAVFYGSSPTNASPVRVTNYTRLLFTEITNLTTTPIKFAPPPFVGKNLSTNYVISDFEVAPGTYNPGSVVDGWTVSGSQVFVVVPGYHLNNSLVLIPGSTLSRTLPTKVGNQYTLRFAYRDAGGAPTITVTIPGVISTNIVVPPIGSGAWQIFAITFTTGLAGTPITISGGGAGATYVDYFTLLETRNNLFYLPEQPMDSLVGKNAQGVWTLEIQDDRAGAYLNAQLVNWQLRFTTTAGGGNYAIPSSASAQSGGGITLPAGNIVCYQVNVPANAVSAANTLLVASGPLNVWFNRITSPGAGDSPDDYLLLGGATNGVSVLKANSAPPNIVPGGIYWLGVQNTNSFNVNYKLGVDFGTTNFIIMPLFLTTTTGSNEIQWYPSSLDAQYQVEWTTNLSPPIVWTTNADIVNSSSLTTNWAFSFTDSGSTNSPKRFYRLIQLP